MPQPVKNLSAQEAQFSAVDAHSAKEFSLFTFLESLSVKWVHLNVRQGKYQLQLTLSNKNRFHFAHGATLAELFENLKIRLTKYGVAC